MSYWALPRQMSGEKALPYEPVWMIGFREAEEIGHRN